MLPFPHGWDLLCFSLHKLECHLRHSEPRFPCSDNENGGTRRCRFAFRPPLSTPRALAVAAPTPAVSSLAARARAAPGPLHAHGPLPVAPRARPRARREVRASRRASGPGSGGAPGAPGRPRRRGSRSPPRTAPARGSGPDFFPGAARRARPPAGLREKRPPPPPPAR